MKHFTCALLNSSELVREAVIEDGILLQALFKNITAASAKREIRGITRKILNVGKSQ